MLHCLKQKCILGLGCKEKKKELVCSWQQEGRKTDFTFGDMTARNWDYQLHL